MKEFLDDRLQLSSRIFYDLELQNLSNDRTDWSDVTRFRKDTPITAEEMETRMKQAADAVSFYQKALAELTSLRDRIAAGNSVDINKEQYEKAIEHFRENAPIYINEEDDIPVKQLAMLVLKGANEEQIAKEWMNPKYDKEV
jgi:tetratricopeptide (TPR) repeat protein